MDLQFSSCHLAHFFAAGPVFFLCLLCFSQPGFCGGEGDVRPPNITTSPCVNLEGNPFYDTTWLAFEEAARSHASTSERPDLPAPKF
eukprot:1141262-Pelagomonas_calceolata.AAC.12